MFKEQLTKVVKKIEQNRQRRIEGKYNHIPTPFKSLNNYWAGYVPGDHILFTGATGSAKSRFTLQNFVLWPLDWGYKNKYNVKVIFFALEDSVEKIVRRLIVRQLYGKYGIELKLSELSQYIENGHLQQSIMDKIHEIEASDYIKTLEDRLFIESGISIPSRMYAKICQIMAKDGDFYLPAGLSDDERKTAVPISFKSKNDTHWVIVTDNLNNISPSEQGNKMDALLVWTRDYVREILCNRFGCTVISIQQQNQEKEKTQFTNTGLAVMQKQLPSIDGLSECKNSAQTAHIILGIFNPARDNFVTCPIGYNTEKLGNYYRHLKLIKANDGESPIELGLYFDGLTETWSEMPNKDDKVKMDELYYYIETLERKRNPTGQTTIF